MVTKFGHLALDRGGGSAVIMLHCEK